MARKCEKKLAITCGLSVILLLSLLLIHTLTAARHGRTDMDNTPLSELDKSPDKRIQTPAALQIPIGFQDSDFYRTIVDNNLFRPLGWRPPRTRTAYRLLGTILPTEKRTEAQAILQSTTGDKIHIVTFGDTLDSETTVTDIQLKQVTLEASGQQKILHLNAVPWIK